MRRTGHLRRLITRPRAQGGTLTGVSAGGQAPAKQQPAKPEEEVRAPKQPPEPPADNNVTVEEAIRQATAILNQLEAQPDEEPDEELMNRAADYINIAYTKEPANPRLHYLRGVHDALSGRMGDAIRALRRFVEMPEGRNEWRAYRILGDLFVGEFPQLAKGNYEKSASLNPGEPSILFGRSRCAIKLGDLKGAIRFAEQAVSADGRKTIAYLAHLASLYRKARRWDEAVREAEAALTVAKQRVKDKPGARQPLAVLDEQYARLRSILAERIRQPDQASADAYLHLAKCIRERGEITERLRLHEILSVLEAGIERTGPEPSKTLQERYGVALAEVGRTKQAVAVFEKLLQADPENAVATEWLRHLRPKPASPNPAPQP